MLKATSTYYDSHSYVHIGINYNPASSCIDKNTQKSYACIFPVLN